MQASDAWWSSPVVNWQQFERDIEAKTGPIVWESVTGHGASTAATINLDVASLSNSKRKPPIPNELVALSCVLTG